MVNGVRNTINLARHHPMFMWGVREGFKYGLLVGVIVGALVPTIVFILIAR